MPYTTVLKISVARVKSSSAEKEEDFFIIQARDNGIGIEPERLIQVCEGIHNKNLIGSDIYGLYNVNERIRLNFGKAMVSP